MKVYLVEDYDCDEKHIFSTLDKAKEFCRSFAEDMAEDFEEGSFDEKDLHFDENEGCGCIFVNYDLDDFATITPYELDED